MNNFKPTKKEVVKAFDLWSNIYDEFMEKTNNTKAQINSTNKILPYIKGKVLEIGAGTGIISLYLAQKSTAKIVALDFSEKMIEKLKEKARRTNLNNIETKCGEAENLPFENNSFDTVLVCFGFNFFTDKLKVLQEMKRVCKKIGKIILMEDEGSGEVEKNASKPSPWEETLKEVKKIKTTVTPAQIKEMAESINLKLETEFREEIGPKHNLLTMIFAITL